MAQAYSAREWNPMGFGLPREQQFQQELQQQQQQQQQEQEQQEQQQLEKQGLEVCLLMVIVVEAFGISFLFFPFVFSLLLIHLIGGYDADRLQCTK